MLLASCHKPIQRTRQKRQLEEQGWQVKKIKLNPGSEMHEALTKLSILSIENPEARPTQEVIVEEVSMNQIAVTRRRFIHVKQLARDYGSLRGGITEAREQMTGESVAGYQLQLEKELPPSAMIALFWNCRRIGKPVTIHHLKELVSSYKPNILFLSELKCRDVSRIDNLALSCNFSCYEFVPSAGKAGEGRGLLLM